MKNQQFFQIPKKISILSLALLVLLLASGALTPVIAYSGRSSNSGNTQQTNNGSLQFIGTTSISKGSGQVSKTGTPSPSPTKDYSKPTSVQGNTPLSDSTSESPSVSSSGVGGSGGSTSAQGLNAFDSGQTNGIDVEPPDQGLCAGNGFVVEAVNLVLEVYDTSFNSLSAPTPLATLVGFPVDQQFGVSPAGGGYILSDPRCLYDTQSGHWFVSFLYLGGNNTFSSGGPFPLGPNTYGAEFVLVSTSSSPLGTYNMFTLNVTSDSLTNNCQCFGDQPLLGADANSIVISTNEFPVFANGFNGAQVYLIDKAALVDGSKSVNYVHFNIGQTVNPPDGNCASSQGLYCFYSIDPATSPNSASYDTSNGGTAWALSSLDFTGAGDNRLAVWSFSNTQSLDTSNPSVTMSYTLLSSEHYFNPGYLVPQKTGPIPLGNVVYSNTGKGGVGCIAACTEGQLASNGDGMWDTVVYAQGALWGAISTIVNQGNSASAKHMGAAFFVVNAVGSSVGLANEGYVAAKNAELLFPSIAVGPSGNALIAFTLTGSNYYPSSAFAWISKTLSSAIGGTIYVSAQGKSPQDGFTEYQYVQYNAFYRPRWGDYTWAVWSGGSIYFSTEYIQSPNCANQVFINSHGTCGGTRDPYANWGTSLNVVPVE